MPTTNSQALEQAILHCETEALQHIGTIQPHGVLLILSSEYPHRILQASDNLEKFWPVTAESIHGQPISTLFDPALTEKIEQLIKNCQSDQIVNESLVLNQHNKPKRLNLRLLISEANYLLELFFEDALDHDEFDYDLLTLLQKSLSANEIDLDLNHYFQQLATLIQNLTGFDRVMVYRFDSDWHGEVIAEKRTELVESYLGLRFPASDIPAQARQLYTLNWLRYVADVNAKVVPIIPQLNPLSGKPVDLTHANLRSFSLVHIEYLRNMGVKASLSISLLQNGRLWGLIACHHSQAKIISNAVQEAAALIGRLSSVRLTSLEAHEQRIKVHHAATIIGELLKHISNEPVENILVYLLPSLLNLLSASGLIMVIESNIYTEGDVPNAQQVNDLFKWLDKQEPSKIFHSDHLSTEYPEAVAYQEIASGILATPLSSHVQNCIIWLRKEQIRSVAWAGKREKNLYTNHKGEPRLAPRQSFAAWTELARGQSLPWSQTELGIANTLAVVLTEGLSQKAQLEKMLDKQKHVEAELHLAATAFESQEAIILTDKDRLIIRVNTAFSQMTGYDSEQVIGENINILKSDRHDAAFIISLWENVSANGFWGGEVWCKRKNGEIYPTRLTITAVKTPEANIKHYVASIIDITENMVALEEIQHLAYYDPLTSLPNRRYLLDRLKTAVAASARAKTKREAALLFIDLDNFKTLNDTLGHDNGDLLLKQVAQRLTTCVRENDIVARLGGDEFVIMLEELSGNIVEAALQAEIVAIKIISILAEPYQLAGKSFRNTPSIGITLFEDYENSVEDLLKQADIAMYQAKKAGRNTFCFFNPQMQAQIIARTTLETELRQAIYLEQFVLYYQLQINQQNDIIGAEVLIRWLHPELGLVPPNQFIPLAEETGLITVIGQWVITTACAQLKNWQQDPLLKELVLSVNVSPKQFRQSNFVSEIKQVVTEYNINPNRLKLELTEGILVEKIEEAITNMAELKDIGIEFSLDDFGTGYSSLQYLKRLPLSQLKIDQSFVRDLEFDNSDQAIVRTIIAIANSFNLNVIAEGVETEQQRRLLAEYGCSNYQGYFFSKPVTLADFICKVKNPH